MTKRDANRGRSGQCVTMAADEYRELIQGLVDQARADQSIAERLAEEARLRFGAEIDVPPEPERCRPGPWSAEQREKHALLEQGIAVAVNMGRRGNLIAWAKERGLFVRVDRATP